MNTALQNIGLFLCAALFSLGSYGTMQAEFYLHHHGNSFQQVGVGSVNFHSTGTNTFITPVIDGSVAPLPECEKEETFAWEMNPSEPPVSKEGQGPLPKLRLRRTDQPVLAFFPIFPKMVGQFARYVRRLEGSDVASFSLTDGIWYEGAWAELTDTDEYQLNGTNHLALSRMIFSMLAGTSVTSFQNQDVFDDIFYTPDDADIWICIIKGSGKGKTRVKIHIITNDNQYAAIFELLPAVASPRSLSPIFVMDKSPLHSRRGSREDIRNHPLTKSRRSGSNLFQSLFSSSDKSKAVNANGTYDFQYGMSFTPYVAFLIICGLKAQKYTW